MGVGNNAGLLEVLSSDIGDGFCLLSLLNQSNEAIDIAAVKSVAFLEFRQNRTRFIAHQSLTPGFDGCL